MPVILILIVVMVALVAVWQLRGVIGSNATTARAVARTMGNSYSGTVVIARNERLYETENKTSIDFVAAEGSHVSRSGVICKVYSSGYNQTEINRLQTYRQEIQSYHVSTVFGSYVDAALDSENQEIANLAQQVRTLVQGRGVGSLGELILGNGRGVFARSPAKAQRIDLIERRLVCPHNSLPVSSTQRHPLYAQLVSSPPK